ncbi:DUF4240 domain-containing protein [Kribbella sp. NPDC056861]|uniref:DUF4240 domain-containing protein n=1 Tax=Kribbella sp. NPDC056861 TaxID=3154857 RepID=UPI003424B9EC
MDKDGFWELVEAARVEVDDTVADPDGVVDSLTKALGELAPEEIAGFGVQLERLLAESYRWELWGAAYLINGGASDDGFDHFRGWLVAQGREVWEAALAGPDSLADVVDEDLGDGFEGFDGEGMLGVAEHAYGAAGGARSDFWKAVEAAGIDTPDVPVGENFDFDDDDEMESRYPLLSALQDR